MVPISPLISLPPPAVCAAEPCAGSHGAHRGGVYRRGGAAAGAGGPAAGAVAGVTGVTTKGGECRVRGADRCLPGRKAQLGRGGLSDI